jgi:sulfur carrier protein ThiS
MPMEIQINGETHEINFNFKAIKAITKLLKCPKISDLEKALNQIGYDNVSAIVAAALNANGERVKEADVENSIESPGFPVEFATALAKAIAPEPSDVADNVAEGN